MNQQAQHQKTQHAIIPTRAQDYPEWYQQVVKAADLAENSSVRGCMVIKPWGYSLWENIQRILDGRIKATGHENAYFPLFIPVSFLEKEAAHIEGFAKECAVVTHHRLEAKEGKLIPAGELEEPLIVRPTSETIIGMSFAKWVQSHRDLPLLINQWANVVRWEMRTRVFLRTAEFLWQEGHTAHATAQEAEEETMRMLEEYCNFIQGTLAIPIIPGKKSPSEKFPGAVDTYTMEAMMQDRKALQMGTSHYLGQTFSKAFGIEFTNRDGQLEHAYTTSWGVTTRLIGGMIMVHSDDDGLRLPPKIAPKHIVIIPFITKPETADTVLRYAEEIAKQLNQVNYAGHPVIVTVDKREMRGGDKNWQWVKKGIPLRIEVGMRDIEAGVVSVARRDYPVKEKLIIAKEELAAKIPVILQEMQDNYLEAAKRYLEQYTVSDIKDFDTMKKYFTPKDAENPEIHGGFINGKWCGSSACEEAVHELKVTIRCLPLKQSHTEGKCIICGCSATTDAIFAKSY
ncbi:MAG: prolyl-tRNA synthetase [Chlamydiales bacterium]|jgi:prolyl-tRNA synthetase|nr:prolyl-tRNA synthetase [Chlamydiales bacterium]